MAKIMWRVQEIARARGYDNARKLGFKAGIYPASIEPIWEGRAKQIAVRTMEKLCEVLEVPPGDLYYYDKDLPNSTDPTNAPLLDWAGRTKQERDEERRLLHEMRERGDIPPAIIIK